MERGTERALRRAGHVTRLIDDRRAKRLIGWRLTQRWSMSEAKRFKPDFVFLSKCHALAPETVSRIIDGKPNSMWYHDAAWFNTTDRPDIAHIVKIGRLTQTFFVSGFEEEWAALGLNAKFLPSGADASITPEQPDERYATDVVFIGTGYDPARAKFLLEVARRYKVKVWGLGWEEWRKPLNWSGRVVEGREFSMVCSSAKIVLGVNPTIFTAARPASGNTASDRTWMVILGGGFYLGHGTPELRKMLWDDVHCAWYSDLDSCLGKIGHYLEDTKARERIRRDGDAFVREHHSFDARIHNLLSGEGFVNPLK
jgi:glycosyl transferase family 1